MKMIIAIVQDQDASSLIEDLTNNRYRITKLSSTGGFLKAGSTTLLMGVKEEEKEEVIELIRSVCTSKKHQKDGEEVVVGGANLFILDVDQFVRL